MSQAQGSTNKPVIVLVRPQLGQNIGKAARAMLNFGLTELRPGQTVLVRFGPGPKGMMAAEVRPDSQQPH